MESWARLELAVEEQLDVAQEDVGDFFYHLGIPRKLGERFALPGQTMEEIRGSPLISGLEDVKSLSAEQGTGLVFPFLCVLPMGFSWAFHVAHQAHRTLPARLLPGVPVVEDRAPVRRLEKGDTSLLLYAENENHFGAVATRVHS